MDRHGTDEPDTVRRSYHEATFAPDWMIFRGVHGGFVVAEVLRAATEATGRRPASASVHFHAPVQVGPARMDVDVWRSGRSAATATVAIVQETRRVSALVLLDREVSGHLGRGCGDGGAPVTDGADPDPAEPFAVRYAPPGEVFPPLDTPQTVQPRAQLPPMPFNDNVEVRFVGSGGAAADPESTLLRAWVRLRVPLADPVARAAVLLDALAPSLFVLHEEPITMPTVEMTVHFAPPVAPTTWSAIWQRTAWWDDAYCVDDAEVRNAHGALIAQARQRRRIMAPRPPAR